MKQNPVFKKKFNALIHFFFLFSINGSFAGLGIEPRASCRTDRRSPTGDVVFLLFEF